MHSVRQIQAALEAIHYAAPCIIFIYFMVAITASICTIPKHQVDGKQISDRTRRAIMINMLIITLSYIAEAALVIVQMFNMSGPLATTDSNIYTLSSCLVWGVMLVLLLNSKDPKWWPFYVSWLGGFAVESTLLGLSMTYSRPSNAIEIVQTVTKVCHIALIISLLALYSVKSRNKNWKDENDEEAAPLLARQHEESGGDQIPQNDPSYGSTGISSSVGSEQDKAVSVETSEEDEETKREDERMKRLKDRMKEKGNWFSYAREFLIFVPYVWSPTRKDLQLRMIGVGAILICVRALNVLVPRQLGIVVNSLGVGSGGAPLLQLGIYIILAWASSSAGLLGLKNWLWYPVEMKALQAIKTASYNHIMDLSCDFHDGKQSGELYNSMWHGESILDLMKTLTFQLLPMVVDLVVACVYLYTLFGPYMFLIVSTTSVIYFWVSANFTGRQADAYRHNVKYARQEWQVMFDSMGGWKTVSYFNRHKYAKDQYSDAVTQHFESKKTVYIMNWLSTTIQDSVLDMGLFGACFFAIYQVIYCGSSVGSFVTLLTYWASLSGPLSFLSSAHRGMMSDLIDAEQLLELFKTKPSVVSGTKMLPSNIEGKVDFNHVNFGYDGKKQTITDLSFHVARGKTIALIGETGGGKSTILKLLFRFYDVSSGSLRIDGHDIRELSLESLREKIGVVPQDPTLFNDTIMTNLRYARLDATNEEIIEACKAAAVHDKIMTFTDHYQSKVGEHGVRLSGGELQRIAIARAILKNPSIILLDEATSSVDSETEGKIQEALKKLSQDRTTFVVAHRLSTIMDADLILVIKDGKILEQGTPAELMKAKGKYYSLWVKQMGVTNVDPATAKEAETTADDSGEPGNGNKDGKAKVDQAQQLVRDTIDSKKPVEELKRPSLSREPSSPSKRFLCANAPEFVPHRQNANTNQQDDAPRLLNHPSLQPGHDIAVTTAEEDENTLRSRKRKPKQDISIALGPSVQTDGTIDAIRTQSDSTQILQPSGNGTEPKAKRSRFNRRRQSKNNPSSSSLGGNQGDKAGECNVPPIENRQAQTTSSPNRRRYSTPATRLLNLQNPSGSTKRHRKRLGGHSRDTSSTSQDPSTGTSGEWSPASTAAHRESLDHTNTPVSGATSSGDSDVLRPRGNVRFTTNT